MNRDQIFVRMMDEVERQGGAHLPGICQPTIVEYKAHTLDLGDGVKQQFSAQGKLPTTGCHRERRFIVPDQMPEGFEGEPKLTTACMDDDAMDKWPRFRGVYASIWDEDES